MDELKMKENFMGDLAELFLILGRRAVRLKKLSKKATTPALVQYYKGQMHGTAFAAKKIHELMEGRRDD